MKILIVTQKVDKDDDVLGFFHDWIKEFAKQYEKVSVICLEKGEYELPENVGVFSLGKEKQSKTDSVFRIRKRLVYIFRFYGLVWRLRKEYDVVFVHMIPLYALLGAFVWRLLGKKIALWYAHGHVSMSLRMAEKMIDTIYTSTTEGCRLESDKIKIVGQGIDTEIFNINDSKVESPVFTIISVGRIAPIKNYETLIRATDILVKGYKLRNIRIKIVGAALFDEHEHYFRKLKKISQELNLEKYIEFTGSIPYKNIVQELKEADMMASTSKTGSLDKAMLEAMSMGLPVLTCSEAMTGILMKKEKQLMYKPGDFNKLAELMAGIINMPVEARSQLGKGLREIVVEHHGLERLIRIISSQLGIK